MPAIYAHYRLGQEVRERLDGIAAQAVETYPQLYLIGLHGPDILFYYKPLGGGEINREGSLMHHRSGRSFFEQAAGVIQAHADQERLAYLSYAYGFICHFALDVTCHGYIAQKEKSGITHSEIESEFDRELMVIDGIEPVSHRLTDHLVPSAENAQVIAEFYSVPIKAEDVKKAVKGMIFYSNLFLSPNRIKRWFVDLALRLSGHYKWLHGMMISYEKNPACDDSCRKLLELYEDARELAVRLISEYGEYLEGAGELDDIYQYNFESEIPADNEA